MKKVMYNLGMVAILGLGVLVNAQTKEKGAVGINTQEPQATLDVRTFDVNGTTNEGIIAPKLTKERVANIKTPVEGTLVYVTDASYTGNSTVVTKIDSKGYYYFDGTEWVKAREAAAQTVGATNGLTKTGGNIKLGGVLSEDTNIVLNDKYSFFLSRYNRNPENVNNQGIGFYSTAEGNKLKSYSDAQASKSFSFDVQTDNQYTAPYSSGNRLFFKFNIQGNEKLRINSNGLGVGTSDITAKLDVNGDVRIRSIAEGDTANDYVLLADADGNVKKAAAGSLGATYTGSTSVVLKGNSFERAALSGDVTSAQNSNEVTVNAIQGKSISDATPTDGQVLQWNGTSNKWEPATNSGKELQDLTGGIRKVDQANATEWAKEGTFCLIQTTTATIDMPEPANYKDKILSVNNQAGTTLNYGGAYQPVSNSTLDGGKGHILMSDGEAWYVIGGSY